MKRHNPNAILNSSQAAKIRKALREDPRVALEKFKATVLVNRGLQIATRYGFDAITSSTKRKTPPSSVGSLDQEFSGPYDRDKMISLARELFTNFSFARGILLSHLRNVVGSGPRLQVRSGDADFDKRAETFWNDWSDRCDIRGNLDLGWFLRLGESHIATDGDCGVQLVEGGYLLGIEGDRIRNENHRTDSDGHVGGIDLTPGGRPIQYHVWKRGQSKGTMKYDKAIPAENFVHLWRPERFDGVRGVSWFMASANDIRDLQEIMEAVKGKVKLENMLSVAVKSDAAAQGLSSLWGTPTEYTVADSDGNDESRYQVKLGQGVHSFELRPGEDISVIESKNPNANFEPFTMLLIRVVSLCLEMPLEIALHYYTRGSYSGHRAAFLQYYDACRERRREIERQFLRRIYRWRVSRAIKAGELDPPKQDADEWGHKWQWPGLPLLDPDKERAADAAGYKLGAESLDSICGRSGEDWEDVARQRAREIKRLQEIAKEEGVDPVYLLPAVDKPGEKPRAQSDAPGQSGQSGQPGQEESESPEDEDANEESD